MSLVPVNDKCTSCLIIFSIYLLVLSPSVKTLFISRENNWKLDIVVLHPYRRECFHPPSLVVCLRLLVKCLLLCMLVWWLNTFLLFCDARFERHRRGRGLPQECIWRSGTHWVLILRKESGDIAIQGKPSKLVAYLIQFYLLHDLLLFMKMIVFCCYCL
jgi:hypothetical protein